MSIHTSICQSLKSKKTAMHMSATFHTYTNNRYIQNHHIMENAKHISMIIHVLPNIMKDWGPPHGHIKNYQVTLKLHKNISDEFEINFKTSTN